MRPRKKYPLNQESKRIVGKNRCDLKEKYLLNQESKRIVGKNACVPRKKYPLYLNAYMLNTGLFMKNLKDCVTARKM